MTYEINNVSLFDLLRNRPGPVLRRQCRSVVWPGRAADVPGIPFKSLANTVRLAFAYADAANHVAEALLNSPDGIRDMVQHKFHCGRLQGARPSNTDKRGIPDGKRDALRRQRNDMCDMDRREAREAALARREACKNQSCPAWEKIKSFNFMCLDRQWAGKCSALKRSGGGSNASSDASIGRCWRD